MFMSKVLKKHCWVCVWLCVGCFLLQNYILRASYFPKTDPDGRYFSNILIFTLTIFVKWFLNYFYLSLGETIERLSYEKVPSTIKYYITQFFCACWEFVSGKASGLDPAIFDENSPFCRHSLKVLIIMSPASLTRFWTCLC